jgi:hypothetical protein
MRHDFASPQKRRNREPCSSKDSSVVSIPSEKHSWNLRKSSENEYFPLKSTQVVVPFPSGTLVQKLPYPQAFPSVIPTVLRDTAWLTRRLRYLRYAKLPLGVVKYIGDKRYYSAAQSALFQFFINKMLHVVLESFFIGYFSPWQKEHTA